MTITHWQARW